MYLFSVDFSKNNLLTEQINVDSLYDLQILDKSLTEHQLINFSDLSIKKGYLINSKNNMKFSLFDTENIIDSDIYREIALVDNDEIFVAFRNDVFFEKNNTRFNIAENDELVFFYDKSGFAFCVAGSIGNLKRLLNKNFLFSEIFTFSEKYFYFNKVPFDGYATHLNNIKKYKSLLYDILHSKTYYKPPFIAEGVFTDGLVPFGDYSIIPPVYIGERVQIESGSVIGPDTVIHSNTLISENSSVKKSVLFENVYISSNCYIDGAICCDNASIKRNTAVFSGSVIGSDALIGEDMTLENGSVINKNVRYDKFSMMPIKNKSFSFENKFQGLSPDKAAVLGSAVANLFNKPKIVVGCDGSPDSLSLRLAFMSGLIASGSECLDVGITFKSQMFFCLNFCDCDYFAFISGFGGGTDIEIRNSDNEQLSKTQCYNLFDFCNKGEIVYQKSENCKNIRQIKGLKRMYVQEITTFSEDLPFDCKFICKNPVLLKTIEGIFKRCVGDDKYEKKFLVYLNESATNINIEFKDSMYSQKTLKKIVFFFLKRKEKIKFFESDLSRILWRYDSVFLLVSILNIIKHTGKDIDALVAQLPRFYVKSKSINLKFKDSEIAERIGNGFSFFLENNAFNIKCNNGFVKVINNKEKENINIIASSNDMAVSEELCNNFSRLLSHP